MYEDIEEALICKWTSILRNTESISAISWRCKPLDLVLKDAKRSIYMPYIDLHILNILFYPILEMFNSYQDLNTAALSSLGTCIKIFIYYIYIVSKNNI